MFPCSVQSGRPFATRVPAGSLTKIILGCGCNFRSVLIGVDSWVFKIILVELNSVRGIFATRGDSGLLPVVLHLFIFHSRQLLLRERTGKHSGLRFMSESSTRHISHGRCLSPEQLNPASQSMLSTATFGSIYGFKYQLFMGFPNNEKVVNKTQETTNTSLIKKLA